MIRKEGSSQEEEKKGASNIEESKSVPMTGVKAY